MNTNPTAKRILCYGDSLTRGRLPIVIHRYNSDVRWTGVLQNILGNEFEVIEEGLRGRTVFGDYNDLKGRDGFKYRYPCLLSQFPLDMIILFLGTNDLQKSFNHTIQEIRDMFAMYKTDLIGASEEFKIGLPQVILVSPPYIDEKCLKDGSAFGKSSGVQSRNLAVVYNEIAVNYGWYFLDAASIAGCGVGDGIHLNIEQNRKLAETLASIIQNMPL